MDGDRVTHLPAVRQGGAPQAPPLVISEETLNEALKKAGERARREERSSQTKARDAALEAQAAAHAAELARIGGETVHRERSAYAHGWHKASWMVGGPVLLAGLAAGAGLVLATQNVVFDAGADATRQGVTVGTMIERMRGEEAQPLAPEGE